MRASTHARTHASEKTPLEVVQRTARHAKGPGVDFDATSIVITIIVLMLMRMHESGGVQTKRLGRRRPHLTSPASAASMHSTRSDDLGKHDNTKAPHIFAGYFD